VSKGKRVGEQMERWEVLDGWEEGVECSGMEGENGGLKGRRCYLITRDTEK
jgi:hypothetical protein